MTPTHIMIYLFIIGINWKCDEENYFLNYYPENGKLIIHDMC